MRAGKSPTIAITNRLLSFLVLFQHETRVREAGNGEARDPQALRYGKRTLSNWRAECPCYIRELRARERASTCRRAPEFMRTCVSQIVWFTWLFLLPTKCLFFLVEAQFFIYFCSRYLLEILYEVDRMVGGSYCVISNLK